MCGRYSILTEEELVEIREIIEEVNRRHGEDAVRETMATGEIYPTNIAPVVAQDGARLMRWGFPMYGKSGVTINARRETAAEKSMFRAALRARRVVVPTTGFYEWSHEGKKAKEKFMFQLPTQNALYLAGLHTNYALPDGTREDRYVILTTDANESMSPYHNRMPVYVAQNERDAWIHDPQATGDILNRKQPELRVEKVAEPAKQLSFFD